MTKKSNDSPALAPQQERLTEIAKCGHEVKVVAPGTASEEVPDCCAMCDELLGSDEDYDYERSDSCYDCGGRGWKVICIDDLCHGQDECIHGDPPVPCRNCNPKGEKHDNY